MNIMNDIRKELEEFATGLSKLEKNDSFPIPENYFYHLPDKINEKIKKRSKRWLLFPGMATRNVFLKVSLAFSLLLVVGSGVYFITFYSNQTHQQMKTETFILDNIDELTITEFVVENKKSVKNNEQVEPSLDNIDESIMLDEL